jgi:hypothetical protein
MPRPPEEAPLYVAAHDMLAWLIPHLEKWPRPQRFLLARQTLESATQFYRLLLRARKVRGQGRGLVGGRRRTGDAEGLTTPGAGAPLHEPGPV